jgi:hypothetical protein
MAWIYFQDTPAQPMPLQDMLERSPIVKLNAEHSVFFCEECGRVRLRQHQSGTMPEPCPHGSSTAKLTQSLAVGHARITALRAISLAWRVTTANCLKKSFDLLASLDRHSSIWKMSQESLLLDLEIAAVKWPWRGLIFNGECYPLQQWARPTCANAYGFWPTPTATDYGSNGHGVKEGKQISKPSLGQIARRFYPTPTASEAEHGGPGRSYGDGSPTLSSLAAKIGQGTSLNPQFVEVMQGLPIDATELEQEGGVGFPIQAGRRSKEC